MLCDRIWEEARLVTCAPGAAGLAPIDDGLVACRNGRIVYAGPKAEAPSFDAHERVNLKGRWITPGLIDCHTHLVYAGDRSHEFEMRLAGVPYAEIARRGGGIVHTMRATRAASFDDLTAAALPRLDALMGEGVTTVEIKSGYGMSLEAELRQLQVARGLADIRDVTVFATLLAAHALPPEFAGDRDGYIDWACEALIPAAAQAGLADAVDGFCETIGFTSAQIERVMQTAAAHALPVKLHAEQLSNQGGAALAARHGALSADHLEHLDDAGAAGMAAAGTVGVLLPGAFYFMRETHKPPVETLRRHGVAMALATDSNPGTSPMTSLLTVINMGAVLFGLTLSECLLGVTLNAAKALGAADRFGSLEAGKACDLAIWNIERLSDLAYRLGPNPLHARVKEGR